MYGQLALPGLAATPDDDGDQLTVFDVLADQHRPGCAEAGYLHAPAGLVCRCPLVGA